MAALTTLNITEKNANNSLSVTVKVNVTKEGVFTTTLSKEDVDKIHSYGGCSACVEIMADDDNGVSMMHYIDYEDIIGVELIKN